MYVHISQQYILIYHSYSVLVDDVDDSHQFALVSAIAHVGHTARLHKPLERLKEKKASIVIDAY